MIPKSITLQFAYRSIAYAHGIIEDVLVKADEFIFPVDFDFDKDQEISIILGSLLQVVL